MLDIILRNVRVATERQGDIIAKITALNVGTDRLTALLDRYGKETAFEAIAEMKARSEQLMRSHIETIPDGTYAFTDHIDSDGIEWEPLAIHLEMAVKGSDVHLDFSQSSPPCRGPLNSVRSTTMAGRVHRHQAHLPRRTHQCRLFYALYLRSTGDDLPQCPAAASRCRLCLGGLPAHY